jgi:hypothetical protein
VLRFLTTFRLPPHLHAEITPIIQAVIDGVLSPLDDTSEQGDGEDGSGDAYDDGESPEQDDPNLNDPSKQTGNDGGGDQDEAKVDAADGGDEGVTPGTHGEGDGSDQLPSTVDDDDADDGIESDSGTSRTDDDDVDGDEETVETPQPNAQPDEGEGGDGDVNEAMAFAEVGDVAPLLRVLKGRMDRGNAQFVPHRGGQPSFGIFLGLCLYFFHLFLGSSAYI